MKDRWNGCLTLMTVALLLLAGCQSSPSTSQLTISPMWQDYFIQALSDPNLSSFQREVLSDYVVTEAEYKEAQDLYFTCMADQGYTVSFDGHGYSMVSTTGGPHEGEEVDLAINAQCDAGTLNWVEQIYYGMQDNPEGLSGSMLVRQCYNDHGVLDGHGLTNDEFQVLIEDNSYIPSTPEGCLCLFDPTGRDGLSIAQAEELAKNRSSLSGETITIPG